ncbi:MAG: dipeptide epimerase, partial [Gemmatimonadetes bacterium]|nr:dipeptide epimerase [Gemmatimonadota bacterium]
MKLSWEKLSLRPDVPFRTSRSVQQLAERVWARIELDGLEGWGEADPSPYYGESAETVADALDRMRPVLAS